MILVVLGTQDKQFTRLLEAVDREIEKGVIKEKVVVQAGQTKYESKNMEIFDLVPAPEFNKLMDEADIIITHGGAGTILTGIKKGKKIIAAPRLAKYMEHHNDHQKQIIGEFASRGYILELRDFNKLGAMIQKIRNFKPKKFESNTQNMIKLIDDYIKDSNHTSWYHKCKNGLLYWSCFVIVNILSFMILRSFPIHLYLTVGIAWVIGVIFAFIYSKIFDYKEMDNKDSFKEGMPLFVFRILSIVFDIGVMFVFVDLLSYNELLSKVVANIFVVIINFVFSKLFFLKK